MSISARQRNLRLRFMILLTSYIPKCSHVKQLTTQDQRPGISLYIHLFGLRRTICLRQSSCSGVGRWHRERHAPHAPWPRAIPAFRCGRQDKHDARDDDEAGGDYGGFAIHTQ